MGEVSIELHGLSLQSEGKPPLLANFTLKKGESSLAFTVAGTAVQNKTLSLRLLGGGSFDRERLNWSGTIVDRSYSYRYRT